MLRREFLTSLCILPLMPRLKIEKNDPFIIDVTYEDGFENPAYWNGYQTIIVPRLADSFHKNKTGLLNHLLKDQYTERFHKYVYIIHFTDGSYTIIASIRKLTRLPSNFRKVK